MTRTRVPALGAEGWFTLDAETPALLGDRCTACGSYAFPPAGSFCRNPRCASTAFATVPLSRRGKVWSYTDAQYAPPSPYVAPQEGHVPFCIAAVELAEEGLVVLGQVVAGVTVDDLQVGTEVEVVLDTLFSDEDHDHLIWKWRPVAAGGAG
ncbi:MAG: benzoylsuccinyl-CoA thiolase [Acidimicrobiales bacterium]|nr:benzoylsuccinyl-CoA thiolase [Acidimicrobiales bacterium]